MMKNSFDFTMLKSINCPKILKRLVVIILVGTIGNIIFSLYTSNSDILSSLANFSYHYFLLAIFLTIVPWFTHAFRLLIWTRFLGKKTSFKSMFEIVIGNEISTAVTPSAVGGAPVKIGMLIKNGLNSGSATSLTIFGSVEDAIFIFCAVIFALIFSESYKLLILQDIFKKIYNPVIWIIITISSLFIFYKFRHKIASRFTYNLKINRVINTKFYKVIKEKFAAFSKEFKLVYNQIINKGKWRLLISMFLTGIQWICRYSVVSALLASMGISVDPVRFFFLQWVVFTFMSFIPTPGATAGAETMFYLIYQSLLPVEIIGIITLGWRFLTFYFLILLGIILLGLMNLPKNWLQKFSKPLDPQPVQLTLD